MQKIPAAISQNKMYFVGLLITLLLGMLFLIMTGKAAAFISLNSYHPFFLNVFFINYTFIGDGIFALGLITVMFFYFKKSGYKKTVWLNYVLLYKFQYALLIIPRFT